jgi:glyoxylase-like metal-dependent hydrolase (beta-lactamase superfamily II)
VRELAPGLWDWQARHPEWQEGDSVPAELAERATAIVLTAPWHERDSRKLVGELHVPVYAARPDSASDLIELFGVDPARVEGFISEDLRWLIHEDGGEWREISADEPPPFGIEVFAGRTRNDLVFWVEEARAVIAGDTLADWGDGLAIRSEWLSATTSRDEVVARLRPLLDRLVEIVLPAHGAPTGRAALERALLGV